MAKSASPRIEIGSLPPSKTTDSLNHTSRLSWVSAVTQIDGPLFWCDDWGNFGKGASRPLGQGLDPPSFSFVYRQSRVSFPQHLKLFLVGRPMVSWCSATLFRRS